MFTKLSNEEASNSPFSKKEIQKHLKTLRNTLKEINIKARIGFYQDTDAHGLKYKDSHEFVLKLGTGRVDCNSLHFISDEIMALRFGLHGIASHEFLEYALNVAKELGYQVLVVYQSYSSTSAAENLGIKPFPVSELDSGKLYDLFGDFKRHSIENPYYVNVEENYVEDTINIYKTIESFFVKKQAIDKTIMFSDNQSWRKKIKFFYYNNGFKGKFEIHYNKSQRIFVAEDLEIQKYFKTLDELCLLLEEMFEKSEIHTKLINIIEPPKQHLQLLLDRLFTFSPEDFTKSVFDVLCHYYEPEEIEEKSLYHNDKRIRVNLSFYKNDIVYMELFDYYLVTNRKTEQMNIFKDKSKAIDYFKSLSQAYALDAYQDELATIDSLVKTI